jgi:hypothetical protein
VSPNAGEPLARICLADDSTFWPWLKWPEFAPYSESKETLVIIPLTGLADAALGHPLDAEETVLLSVLKKASELSRNDGPVLILPPLRFVTGPSEYCAFPISPPLAHAQIREVVESVAAGGFQRIVLFNSSPWNEDLINVAARDVRVSKGLVVFCVNLAALGLDFHPFRSTSRRLVQTLLTGLYGREPKIFSRNSAGNPFARDTLPPVLVPWENLDEGIVQAPLIVQKTAERLGSLLREIRAHANIPDVS